MATTPLSDELVTKLAQATAWRFKSKLGPVFTPRFFCCTDPNEMGTVDGKEPVAVLSLSPNPCLPGDTVTFDGTDSYDPDGTVTDWDWTFEDGTPASSTADTDTVTWADPGEYEVELVVEDGTGVRSSPARTIQVVKEPQGAYFIGTSTGVYLTEDGGQNWTAKNTGLSGDGLVVNDLAIDPATQHFEQHEDKTLWIATDGGLYVSNDGGGGWTQKNPASVSNAWGDSPAPAVADLSFGLVFFVGNRLFAVGRWQNGSSLWRSWIFYSDQAAAMRADTSGSVTWSEVAL
jgi:PKD repeat protein